MIYKRCSMCGKRLPTGQECQCRSRQTSDRNKRYDKHQRNKQSYDFYHSPAWLAVRQRVLDRADGLDEYEMYASSRVVLANTVHHIVPLSEDKSKAIDMTNLIAVSSATHNMIHSRYDSGNKQVMQEELRKAIR